MIGHNAEAVPGTIHVNAVLLLLLTLPSGSLP
jgi:hypothetical protein